MELYAVRREILMAALRGGMSYDEAKQAADSEVPPSWISEAHNEYQRRMREFEAEERPKANPWWMSFWRG
jgi:hypothetical protein